MCKKGAFLNQFRIVINCPFIDEGDYEICYNLNKLFYRNRIPAALPPATPAPALRPTRSSSTTKVTVPAYPEASNREDRAKMFVVQKHVEVFHDRIVVLENENELLQSMIDDLQHEMKEDKEKEE